MLIIIWIIIQALRRMRETKGKPDKFKLYFRLFIIFVVVMVMNIVFFIADIALTWLNEMNGYMRWYWIVVGYWDWIYLGLTASVPPSLSSFSSYLAM